MPKAIKNNKRDSEEHTLYDLFVNTLKVVYDVETHLVKTLPKSVKKIDNKTLKKGAENHIKKTERHVGRIESAFDALGLRPQKIASQTIRGLVADAEWIGHNIKGTYALDAGLLSALQTIERYEMAMYECAIVWAKVLDKTEVSDLLQETYDEEAEMSDELTELAAEEIDEKAMPKEIDEDNPSNQNEESEEDDDEEGDGDYEDEDEDEDGDE